MKTTLIALCFMGIFSLGHAQEVSEDTLQPARNSLFVELGGNAMPVFTPSITTASCTEASGPMPRHA